MNKDRNFLSNLDDWGTVLTDTYERANDFHTLFVGIINGESYPFNINLVDYNKLFKQKPIVNLVYEYCGASFVLYKDMIDSTLNDENYFSNLDSIEFNLSLMGIDLELLYNYEAISDEEYESKQLDNDYTDLELQIEYKSETDNNINYISFAIGTQNEPSDYTSDSSDQPIIYLNPTFAKYIIETAIETYKKETNYLEMTDNTKNRMLKLIKDVNKQNGEFCQNNVKNFKY